MPEHGRLEVELGQARQRRSDRGAILGHERRPEAEQVDCGVAGEQDAAARRPESRDVAAGMARRVDDGQPGGRQGALAPRQLHVDLDAVDPTLGHEAEDELRPRPGWTGAGRDATGPDHRGIEGVDVDRRPGRCSDRREAAGMVEVVVGDQDVPDVLGPAAGIDDRSKEGWAATRDAGVDRDEPVAGVDEIGVRDRRPDPADARQDLATSHLGCPPALVVQVRA